jgi:uncharacterized protein (DUF2062 family)
MIKAKIRSFYETCICLKGEPGPIAGGLAMGVFVGVTPTIPFHTTIILFLGVLLRQNITAAYFGSWMISNPVTIPLLYYSQYELGRFVLGMEPCNFILVDYSLTSIAHLGGRILIPLLTGGMIMAPLIALPAYFISRRLIKACRSRSAK